MNRFARLIALLAALCLAAFVGACSDDETGGGSDTETDTGGDSGGDMTPDMTPDQTQDPTVDPTQDPTQDPEDDTVADAGDDVGEDSGLVDLGDDFGFVDVGLDVEFDGSFDVGGDVGGDVGEGEGILLLTEIVDGDLPGGLPKWIEVTNVGDGPVDLSEYSIGVWNSTSNTRLGANPFGSTTWAVVAGTVMLEACGVWVVSFESGDSAGTSTFNTVYGEDADNFEPAASFNGDDAISLFLGHPTDNEGSGALAVDIIGTIGVNGDDADWDYTDSYARRNADSDEWPDYSGCGTDLQGCSFDISNWTFAGRAALDGQDAAGHAASTFPFMHTVDSCP